MAVQRLLSSGVNQHARQLEVGYIFLILDDPVSRQTESVSDPHLSWWGSSVGWVVEHMLHLFLFAFHNVADLPQLIALLVLAYLLICNRSSFCFTPFLPTPWQQPPCFLLFETLVSGSWFPILWPPPCQPNEEFQRGVCLWGCCLQPSGIGQRITRQNLTGILYLTSPLVLLGSCAIWPHGLGFISSFHYSDFCRPSLPPWVLVSPLTASFTPPKEFQTRVCLCGCCLQPSGTG